MCEARRVKNLMHNVVWQNTGPAEKGAQGFQDQWDPTKLKQWTNMKPCFLITIHFGIKGTFTVVAIRLEVGLMSTETTAHTLSCLNRHQPSLTHGWLQEFCHLVWSITACTNFLLEIRILSSSVGIISSFFLQKGLYLLFTSLLR